MYIIESEKIPLSDKKGGFSMQTKSVAPYIWIIFANILDLAMLCARSITLWWPLACVVLWVAAVIKFHQAGYHVDGLWMLPLVVILATYWLTQRCRRRR